MLEQFSAAIARHSDGMRTETAVPRLTLIAVDEIISPAHLVYEPKICFTAEGAKRTVAMEREWVTGRGEMFLNALTVPVTAAFDQLPYRSAVLHLDSRVLADLLLELGEAEPATLAHPATHVAAPMPPELVDAVTRWVRLLDTPDDIRPLAPRVESEILYRLLGTALGPTLRQFALADSTLARVRAAAAWICDHYSEPLSVDAIAAQAHMSTATLHRHFKAATGMSPVRYQKHLRLQQARQLMVTGDTTAALVAQAVGYASATQFNREYRHAYGLPPMQDAHRMRQLLTT